MDHSHAHSPVGFDKRIDRRNEWAAVIFVDRKATATAATCCLVALVLFPVRASAYTIEISNDLNGGDFYMTTTTDEAAYDIHTGGIVRRFVPADGGDLNRTNPATFTQLNSGFHPVKGKSGKTGNIMTKVSLAAMEGSFGIFGPNQVGTAKQFFNIGGTFKVLPDTGDAQMGNVNLLAKGIIDGYARIDDSAIIFADDASANFSADIFIQGLGTAQATASAKGQTTTTIGVEGTISKEPGVTGSIGQSKSKSSAGTGAQNFFMLGKVPINTDINWNFSMTLEAQNDDDIFFDLNAATARLTQQFVNLTPQGGHVFKAEDPFFSESIFTFDAVSGALSVVHPLSDVFISDDAGILENGSHLANSPIDYSSFLPEVEAILSNGEFLVPGEDALLNSLLRYSGMLLDETLPDGSITFTDGLLEFLDFNDLSVLAQIRLTDITADPSAATFMAEGRDFQYVNASPGSSPLGDELIAFGGGSMWLDPAIITATDFFTASGKTDTAYTVDMAPIPEPTWAVLLFTGLLVHVVGRRRRGCAARVPCPNATCET